MENVGFVGLQVNSRLSFGINLTGWLASLTLPRVELRDICAFHEDCGISIPYSVWTRLVKMTGFFARLDRVAMVADAASSSLFWQAGSERDTFVLMTQNPPCLTLTGSV